MADPNQIAINSDFIAEFLRLKHKLDTLKGVGVTNTPTSISIGGSAPATTGSPRSGPEVIMGQLAANETGGGQYSAKSIGPDLNAGFSTSSNLTLAAFGTLATWNDCLVWNPAEVGASTHTLSTGTGSPPVLLEFTGFTTSETSPRKICILVSSAGSSGSPILTGTLASAWDGTSDTVTITPASGGTLKCIIVGRLNPTPAGGPYPYPVGYPPPSFVATAGDKLTYVQYYTDTGTPENSRGLLINPPWFGLTGSQYQMLQRDALGRIIDDNAHGI